MDSVRQTWRRMGKLDGAFPDEPDPTRRVSRKAVAWTASLAAAFLGLGCTSLFGPTFERGVNHKLVLLFGGLAVVTFITFMIATSKGPTGRRLLAVVLVFAMMAADGITSQHLPRGGSWLATILIAGVGIPLVVRFACGWLKGRRPAVSRESQAK